MYPLLREPEILEVVPYAGNRPAPGDVVVFRNPLTGSQTVHRVIRTTRDGYLTRGDNSHRPDPFVLSEADIRGRVVAALCGTRRRIIKGRRAGLMQAKVHSARRVCLSVFLPLLRPICRRAAPGWLKTIVPRGMRLKVVFFAEHGRRTPKLLVGTTVAGWYDRHQHRWVVRPPFWLLVDRFSLPPVEYGMSLAGSISISLSGEDEEADRVARRLSAVMNLPPISFLPPGCRQVRVSVEHTVRRPVVGFPSVISEGALVKCVLPKYGTDRDEEIHLQQLSTVLARIAHDHGGVLLHAALAAKDDAGVLFVGPGGAGKTTAVSRLPSPWLSLSDDACLAIPDAEGRWLCHPWPTWSRFLWGGKGGKWDVCRSFSIAGIFFLLQSDTDGAEPVGTGRAAALLAASASQGVPPVFLGFAGEQLRRWNTGRFESVSRLAASVPCFILRISLTGRFWEVVERALEGD